MAEPGPTALVRSRSLPVKVFRDNCVSGVLKALSLRRVARSDRRCCSRCSSAAAAACHRLRSRNLRRCATPPTPRRLCTAVPDVGQHRGHSALPAAALPEAAGHERCAHAWSSVAAGVVAAAAHASCRPAGLRLSAMQRLFPLFPSRRLCVPWGHPHPLRALARRGAPRAGECGRRRGTSGEHQASRSLLLLRPCVALRSELPARTAPHPPAGAGAAPEGAAAGAGAHRLAAGGAGGGGCGGGAVGGAGCCRASPRVPAAVLPLLWLEPCPPLLHLLLLACLCPGRRCHRQQHRGHRCRRYLGCLPAPPLPPPACPPASTPPRPVPRPGPRPLQPRLRVGAGAAAGAGARGALVRAVPLWRPGARAGGGLLLRLPAVPTRRQPAARPLVLAPRPCCPPPRVQPFDGREHEAQSCALVDHICAAYRVDLTPGEQACVKDLIRGDREAARASPRGRLMRAGPLLRGRRPAATWCYLDA